jgi:hypothetical protein
MRVAGTVALDLCGVAAGVLLTAIAPARAQEQRGSIVGRVTGPTGREVAGARVEARGPAAVGVEAATTDANGRFELPSLPPGRYDLTASGDTLVAIAEGLEVALGRTLTVELVLGTEGSTEHSPPLPDLRRSASTARIRGDRIEKLPSGRDFLSVAIQAPGANDETQLAGLAIDGASAAEHRYFVDGLDTTNPLVGLAGQPVVVDFVDQVQVESSGYAAEHGGGIGGVINVVTRSGTNIWRGEAGAYFRSDALGGNPMALRDQGRPTLRISPTDNNAAELVTYPDDDYTRVEPGFTLGGPLALDRAWIFGGYWPALETSDRTVTFLASGQTESFRRSDRSHAAAANLSFRLGDSTLARLAASLQPYAREGQLPARAGTANPATDFAVLDFHEPSSSVSLHLDHTGDRSVVSLGGGYFRASRADEGVPNEVRYVFGTTNIGLAGVPPDLQRPRSYTNVPTNSATTRDIVDRVILRFDGSRRIGQHVLKAGVQYDRIGNDVVDGEQQPVVTLRWNESLTTTDGRRVRGEYGYYRVRQIQTTGKVHGTAVSLFAQDTWTLADRLTIDLGLRSEHETVPSYAANPDIPETALTFGFRQKLAPRAGAAWDPRGDGQLKVYGSWGLYYDTMKLALSRGLLGGTKWIEYRYTLDTANWPALGATGCPPACPGALIEALDFTPSANDPQRYRIEQDLEATRSSELTLGLAARLPWRITGSLRYVRKRIDRTIDDVGVVVPAQGFVFYVANPGFGVGEHPLGTQYPAQPAAAREHDSLDAEFSRTLGKGVSLHASYVWSRLHGNYSGFARADEAGTPSPNVTGAFDSLLMAFDDHAQPVFGPLPADRPHQLKAQAFHTARWGTTVGVNYYLASGTPVSRFVSMQLVPVQYLGRASDGRTEVFSQTDLTVQQQFRLGGARRLVMAVNVLNLFNQAAETRLFSREVIGDIPITPDAFFAGFDVPALVEQYRLPRDPRFLMPEVFQPQREIRLALKLVF